MDIGAFEVQAVAPSVTCTVADSLLWPPNHKLVNVGLGVGVDPTGATLHLQVYANDGATAADAADIGPDTLRLRRASGRRAGAGLPHRGHGDQRLGTEWLRRLHGGRPP